MDIFGILEPEPHKNLCGSETLVRIILLRSDFGGVTVKIGLLEAASNYLKMCF